MLLVLQLEGSGAEGSLEAAFQAALVRSGSEILVLGKFLKKPQGTDDVLSINLEGRELVSWAGRIVEQYPWGRTEERSSFRVYRFPPRDTCSFCDLSCPLYSMSSSESPFLWGGTISYPCAVSFSIVSLQGVCLTDAYKMVTSFFPVIE